jgi:NTP pyrophosphatase (non-canonical NTP hydrolase)
MSEPKNASNLEVLPGVAWDGGVSLVVYERAVRKTDHLPNDGLRTAALGFFGEVGSLLSVVKKRRRDAAAFAGYEDAILEELGDVLWYFTCLVNRASLDLSILAHQAVADVSVSKVDADRFSTWRDIQSSSSQASDADLFNSMSRLAELSGALVGALRGEMVQQVRDRVETDLVRILQALVATAEAADTDLDLAARQNLEKVFSRYPRVFEYPPLTDEALPTHERLPRQFELFIGEHEVNGKTYVIQTCNGVIVGDRLTDNKTEADDYRFHDVFHVAYAVHLGWSPILRGLFRVKRKSRPTLDENEDGARAGLIEEGIATFIFGRALERKLFQGLDHLDFDLLKIAQGFVRGFESERCALWQWERAILDGYKMFRELKKHRKGSILADLEAHTLEFRSTNMELQGPKTVGSSVSVGRRE